MLSERPNFLFRRIILLAIRFYQIIISPDQGILKFNRPAACRFYPTCSQYSSQAIEKFGILKGSWLSLKRVLKCHPFHPGGWDPVS